MKKYKLCSAFLFTSLLAGSVFGATALWPDYIPPKRITRITVELGEGVSSDILPGFGLHDIKSRGVEGFYGASVVDSDPSSILARLNSIPGVNAYFVESVAGKLYAPRDELAAAAGAHGMDRELQRVASLRGRIAPAAPLLR
jgi:hypothetical protein